MVTTYWRITKIKFYILNCWIDKNETFYEKYYNVKFRTRGKITEPNYKIIRME